MRFLLFAACIGCGGSLAAGDDAGDAGADTVSTGNDAGDAGADGPNDAFVDPGFRSSLAFQRGSTPWLNHGIFFGAFYASAQAANGLCQRTTSGSCVTYFCGSSNPQMDSNAGTLTLSVNGLAIAQPMPNPVDNTYSTTSIAYSPGDALGVSASGADVPAFAAHTIQSPGEVTAIMPATITTSQDFTLTWSGGEPGATVIIGVARGGFNGSEGVTCTFDATAGTGTIPQSLLATVQNGSPDGDLLVAQQRKTTFAAGAFVIDLVALQGDDSAIGFQ
jgi:hypothetical protein